MVGAQKSNRCDTCLRRKVKVSLPKISSPRIRAVGPVSLMMLQCDEAWPVCGQCKVKNRVCPARPSLKFVNQGSKMQRQQRPESDMPGGFLLERTLHRSPVSRHMCALMPLAPSEILCLSFIDSLQLKDPSFNLRTLGEFLWEVPKYLGNSKPLDDVIACLLAAQKQLARDANHEQTINRRLYGRALQSLQAALAAPESCCSSDTLAATAMMHRIEVSSLRFLVRRSGPHHCCMQLLENF